MGLFRRRPASAAVGPGAKPPGPPEESSRRRSDRLEGTPAGLSDGATWILSDVPPHPDGIWDELWDSNVARGAYPPEYLQAAAFVLLLANYDLEPGEAFALLRDVPPPDLVPAVEAALLCGHKRHYLRSEYVLASLHANGVDPDRVPRRLWPLVLRTLVETGRALKCEDVVGSSKHRATRNFLLGFLKK
jgi:hypothetical protein